MSFKDGQIRFRQIGKLQHTQTGSRFITKAYQLIKERGLRIGRIQFQRFHEFNYSIFRKEKKNPKALANAKTAIKCFVPYNKNERQFYTIASSNVPELCKKKL